MKSTKFLLAISFFIGFAASAATTGAHKITGVVKNLSEKSIELQSESSTLIVPKALLKNKTAKVGDILELSLDDKQFNKITLKK